MSASVPWQITLLKLSVAALTNGLHPYNFRTFGMWPIVDDVTCNV